MRSTIRIILALLALTAIAPAQELPDPVFAQWRDKVDPAVENALRYLARVQRPNGSFPEGYGDSTGIPALVGMTFLSKGHLPTEGLYAESLNRCIDFVLANQ